jgi:hypothetical protein
MVRHARLLAVFVTFLAILLASGFLLLWPPIPQPLWYHDFADQRPLLGVPHLMNVVSNLPFVIVGVWGLVYLGKSRRDAAPIERLPYWVFFAGLVLTGIGSAYYHADPNNDRLVWDRMPLTVTFMALVTAVLAERFDARLAGWLLAPLIVCGVASVLYWHWTEARGAGDLRPYLIVQFLPLVILPIVLLLFRSRYTGTGELWASLGCYGIAKLLEMLDRVVYIAGGIVSGHTLKHLVAAIGAWFVLAMLQRRRELLTEGPDRGTMACV